MSNEEDSTLNMIMEEIIRWGTIIVQTAENILESDKQNDKS